MICLLASITPYNNKPPKEANNTLVSHVAVYPPWRPLQRAPPTPILSTSATRVPAVKPRTEVNCASTTNHQLERCVTPPFFLFWWWDDVPHGMQATSLHYTPLLPSRNQLFPANKLRYTPPLTLFSLPTNIESFQCWATVDAYCMSPTYITWHFTISTNCNKIFYKQIIK